MAVNSKKKGSKNERNVCKAMEEWSGYEFARVPASGGLRWKATDNITGDIICSDPKGNYKFNLSIECKSYLTINFEHILLPNSKVRILDFWEQSVEDGIRGDKEPVLIMRYNGMPASLWFVVIEFSTYLSVRDLFPNDHNSFIIQAEGHKLICFTSDILFQTNYQKFIKLIKKFRKNGRRN